MARADGVFFRFTQAKSPGPEQRHYLSVSLKPVAMNIAQSVFLAAHNRLIVAQENDGEYGGKQQALRQQHHAHPTDKTEQAQRISA